MKAEANNNVGAEGTRPLAIGSVALTGRAVLAPMADVTDLPFRLLCREMGASLAVTEMVSSYGLIYENEKTEILMNSAPGDRPLSVQIFGGDPAVMAEAARRVEAEGADIVDVNMGCPVKKVACKGAGSALLKEPALAGEIISAMSNAVRIPVTVKIRSGWDAASVNAVDVARTLEAAGAKAIGIHPRTRAQSYSGDADWSVTRAVQAAVRIPVLGGGDVFSGDAARRLVRESGCAGVLVARGAIGAPWIFRDIARGDVSMPTIEERLAVAIRHIDLLVEHVSWSVAQHRVRRHLMAYAKGFRGAAEFRTQLFALKTPDDLKAATRAFFERTETASSEAA
ncbi:MAG: tRNA dihydrouridine synthase DusB [Deltaproteobacteria bacterium]|nr:tRNA dihydrouridine synthase DusB [Deltaproteobacteria bacterium]